MVVTLIEDGSLLYYSVKRQADDNNTMALMQRVSKRFAHVARTLISSVRTIGRG
jgi:hypothetical protein